MFFYVSIVVLLSFMWFYKEQTKTLYTQTYCLSNNKKTLNIKNFLFNNAGIILLILVFLYCLRSDAVGGDLIAYKTFYNAFVSGESTLYNPYHKFEFGYSLLNYIFAKIGLPFNSVMIVVGLLFVISFWIFVKKLSPDIYLSFILMMCLGLFEFSLSGLRQTVSIALLMLGLVAISNKKFVLYFILAGFAFFFHATSIILFILPLFYFIKLDIKTFIIFIVLFVIGCFFIQPASKLISEIIKRDVYRDYANLSLSFLQIVTSLVWIIPFTILFCFMLFKRMNSTKMLNLFLWMFLFSILFKLTGLFVLQITQRFTNYFFFSTVCLIPVLTSKMKLKNFSQTTFSFLFILISIAYLIVKLAFYDSCGIVPYEFFF